LPSDGDTGQRLYGFRTVVAGGWLLVIGEFGLAAALRPQSLFYHSPVASHQYARDCFRQSAFIRDGTLRDTW